ncbi:MULTISPECIES: hypothetical protein [unclassified Frankia]|uniref:hypothetical protein n=1 Tax=unclassified Frankia TaxID=2632575 RepID=UPI002AD48123|nr:MULTISPECIES: hypothetical protein [unclassified Frankia]
MGLSIYIENQIHGRSYAGKDAGIWLSRFLPLASLGSYLKGIDEYGDTMFNIPQMKKLLKELLDILQGHPELNVEISNFRELIENIIRHGGYIWISGD